MCPLLQKPDHTLTAPKDMILEKGLDRGSLVEFLAIWTLRQRFHLAPDDRAPLIKDPNSDTLSSLTLL